MLSAAACHPTVTVMLASFRSLSLMFSTKIQPTSFQTESNPTRSLIILPSRPLCVLSSAILYNDSTQLPALGPNVNTVLLTSIVVGQRCEGSWAGYVYWKEGTNSNKQKVVPSIWYQQQIAKLPIRLIDGDDIGMDLRFFFCLKLEYI